MMAVERTRRKIGMKASRGPLCTYPLILGGVEGKKGRLGVQGVRFGYWQIEDRGKSAEKDNAEALSSQRKRREEVGTQLETD
jgi:hypothetical protein